MKLKVRHALICLAFSAACHKNEAPAPAGSGGSGSGVAAPAGSSLAVLDGFEGEIGLAAKGKFGKQETADSTSFTLQVKDGKFRVDLPDSLAQSQNIGKAYALVTPADKKLYLVLDAKKQVISVDFDKFANQAKALSAAHGRPPGGTPPQVTKTGKTDTVAGYSCEIWHIAQEKTASDVCVAEQGTSWWKLPLAGVPAEFAWASEIADGKHFPLRLVTTENGAEQGRIEVTSIQKKPLPADAFVVPAGYNVIDLDQMLGAMMGGFGGMAPGMMPPGALPSGFAPGMLPPGVHLPAHAEHKPKP